MSLFSFLRKYGETEDPLFKSMPVTEPPPDEGQSEDLENFHRYTSIPYLDPVIKDETNG